MIDRLPSLLGYLFWEASLVAFALGLAVYATRSRLGASQDYGAELLATGLLIKLLVGAAVPQTALLALGALSDWTLHAASIALALAAGGVWLGLARHGHGQGALACPGGLNLPNALVCLAILLLAPVVKDSLAPVLEVDSVRHSHFMLQFIDGTAHPFEFFNNYTVLWEAAYLPALVLTDSVYYFALTSVQAPMLFVLASYLLARQFGLSVLVAWLLGLTGLLSGQFWGSIATGVGTLKNDAIAAAGVMLLLLAALRVARAGQLDTPIAVLLAGGLAFASVKFSGPIIAGALFILLTAFYPRKVWGLNARSLLLASAAVAVFLATSGLYYLRNLWQFGNPVYPFILHLGPFSLPGSAAFDPVGTRIVDHLFDPQVWKLFFGIDSSAAERTAFLIKTLFALFILVPVWLLLAKRLPRVEPMNSGGGGRLATHGWRGSSGARRWRSGCSSCRPSGPPAFRPTPTST